MLSDLLDGVLAEVGGLVAEVGDLLVDLVGGLGL